MDIKPSTMEDNTQQLTTSNIHLIPANNQTAHHHQTTPQQQQQPTSHQQQQHQNDDDGNQTAAHEETGVKHDDVHMAVDQNNQSNEELHNESSASDQAFKTPNSYKYPLLKRYYEFGPWVGRNRKAICVGCRLQTSSSQPDRLLKHLNKCSALTESDKVLVQELMNERTANKRKKPMQLKLDKRDSSEGSNYYEGDQNHSVNDDITLACLSTSQNCLPRAERLRPDRSERDSQIDEALTRFIMMCRIPLKAIHSHEFIEFCKALNPDYHIPSREIITNVLIPGLLNII